MGVRVQALVEAALEADATVASAELACVDPQVLWERMDAHGISQNEVARRAGISGSHLSSIMNGKASPSAGVLKRLHAVLFRKAKAETRVMPAEVKVLGWSKGKRHGDGGARRSRARRHGQGRRRSHRRPGALGREGGVRLPRRVRRLGPGVYDARPDARLLCHAEAAAGDCRIDRAAAPVRLRTVFDSQTARTGPHPQGPPRAGIRHTLREPPRALPEPGRPGGAVPASSSGNNVNTGKEDDER